MSEFIDRAFEKGMRKRSLEIVDRMLSKGEIPQEEIAFYADVPLDFVHERAELNPVWTVSILSWNGRGIQTMVDFMDAVIEKGEVKCAADAVERMLEKGRLSEKEILDYAGVTLQTLYDCMSRQKWDPSVHKYVERSFQEVLDAREKSSREAYATETVDRLLDMEEFTFKKIAEIVDVPHDLVLKRAAKKNM